MKLYRIITEEKAIALAKATAELDWKEGKARTKELTGSVKRNSEILSHPSLQKIGNLIGSNSEIQLDHIPYRIHAPKYSKYVEGQQYHLHTDAPWMANTRTDLSCTLFLSKDYKGGELVIDGQVVKGKPGEALVYECGRPHEVKPILSGERICVITWIQSRIRDAHKRRLVSEFRKFLKNFEKDQELFVQGGRIHTELLRMWTET